VLVENRPGAGGNPDADYVAKAAPDGYNIVVGTVGTHSINAAMYAKMPYDMVKATNLKDFVALGKKEGQMTFASPGSCTSVHVSGELFKTQTGIDMQHIPCKGRASAIPDLLGERVTMMFDNMPSSLPLVREGKLRALGVTSAQRSPAAPEIPTIAEQGLPGFEAVSWFALFAPANTPRAVVDKLQKETARVLRMPDVAKKLAGLGLDAAGSTPEELATYQRAEIIKWAKVVKDSGAKVE